MSRKNESQHIACRDCGIAVQRGKDNPHRMGSDNILRRYNFRDVKLFFLCILPVGAQRRSRYLGPVKYRVNFPGVPLCGCIKVLFH